MRGKRLVLAGTIALTVVSARAYAHHGTAAFDPRNVATVTGTVTSFAFVNPHCQIYFDVKNDRGVAEPWQAEITAPQKLSRAGWTKRTLNPGDLITITGPLVRNGKHTMWATKVVGPDGKSLPLNENVPVP